MKQIRALRANGIVMLVSSVITAVCVGVQSQTARERSPDKSKSPYVSEYVGSIFRLQYKRYISAYR